MSIPRGYCADPAFAIMELSENHFGGVKGEASEQFPLSGMYRVCIPFLDTRDPQTWISPLSNPRVVLGYNDLECHG
jgi:hypothetical protein